MAGVAGFEPAHDEIKTRCLTAWRHPSEAPFLSKTNCNLKRKFQFFKKVGLIGRVVDQKTAVIG